MCVRVRIFQLCSDFLLHRKQKEKKYEKSAQCQFKIHFAIGSQLWQWKFCGIMLNYSQTSFPWNFAPVEYITPSLLCSDTLPLVSDPPRAKGLSYSLLWFDMVLSFVTFLCSTTAKGGRSQFSVQTTRADAFLSGNRTLTAWQEQFTIRKLPNNI